MATKKKAARKKKAVKKKAPKTYVKKRQTKGQGNSSTKKDKQRKALPPGKRKSASGKTYYEYRKDHTDLPGKLTGSHKDTKSHNVNIRVVSGINGKMYARIMQNAYVFSGAFEGSKLRDYLKKNEGKWIEIDTDFLFSNQYNTKDGFRIYDAHIDAIKNDARDTPEMRKQFAIKGETCAFLDWKGIKPNVIKIPEKRFGSYDLWSYPELNYYRLRNARKTINFIFWNFEYYIFNGIGYRHTKRISGTYRGDSVPTDVQTKLHKYLVEEIVKY